MYNDVIVCFNWIENHWLTLCDAQFFFSFFFLLFWIRFGIYIQPALTYNCLSAFRYMDNVSLNWCHTYLTRKFSTINDRIWGSKCSFSKRKFYNFKVDINLPILVIESISFDITLKTLSLIFKQWKPETRTLSMENDEQKKKNEIKKKSERDYNCRVYNWDLKHSTL